MLHRLILLRSHTPLCLLMDAKNVQQRVFVMLTSYVSTGGCIGVIVESALPVPRYIDTFSRQSGPGVARGSPALYRSHAAE